MICNEIIKFNNFFGPAKAAYMVSVNFDPPRPLEFITDFCDNIIDILVFDLDTSVEDSYINCSFNLFVEFYFTKLEIAEYFYTNQKLILMKAKMLERQYD